MSEHPTEHTEEISTGRAERIGPHPDPGVDPPPGQPPEASWAREPEPQRPTGPAAGGVVLGTLCLAVAFVVGLTQLLDLRVDWGSAGPPVVIGAGVLLLIAGVAGLLRARDS